MATSKTKLKDLLKKLEQIVNWFDEQEEADVEMRLEKVREGAALIKESRKQLKSLENEFEKVKIEFEETEDECSPKEENDDDNEPDKVSF